MFIGGSGQRAEQRTHVHHSEAARGARRVRRRRSSRGCGRSSTRSPGARLFLQAAQDVRVGGRAVAHPVPIHAAGRRYRASSTSGRRRCSPSCKTLPELRDVATDQQTGGTTLTLTINRDQASRYGIDAAADRRHALRRVRPAPDRAVFHAAQQLPRDHGGAARRCRAIPTTLDQIYLQVADDRRAGPAGGLRQMDDRADRNRCRSATRASSRRSPSASTSAQGVALGQATRRDRARPRRSSSMPATINTAVPGQCPGVPGFALAPCRC